MKRSFWKYVVQGKEDIHGSASFMGYWERRKLISKRNNGVVIDGVRKLPLDLSFQGNLIVAPTGQGKSTCFCIPQLLRAEGQSLVVTDPSGDMLQISRGYLLSKGYVIHTINPNELGSSDRFNPILDISTYTEAQKTANTLIESAFPKASASDGFWNQSAIELISVLIRAQMRLAPDLRTLSYLLELLEKFGAEQETVDGILASNLDDKGYHQYRAFLAQEEKMKNSVLSTAKTALGSLHDPIVAELTSTTTFDFNSLRAKPTALFIQVGESDLKYYNFFLSLLFARLFKFVLKANPLDGELHPIFFVLDESGHIKIDNLPTVATTIRRRRCSLSLVLQDLDQLRALYGQQANAIIRGGMVNHLYFGGLDINTCEVLERTMGKRTVYYSESGYKSLSSPSQSRETQMSKSLMAADEIRTMKGRSILISSNRSPVLLKMYPWYKQRELVKRSKL